MKIAVIGGFASSLINFRGALLTKMVASGHQVVALAPGEDETVSQALTAMGVRFRPLLLRRTGMNPFSDLVGFVHLCCVLWRERPDVVLNYTIKPVIYGGFAASVVRVRRICSLITGLGYAFTSESMVKGAVRLLYRQSLRRSHVVFFQNTDDRDEFRRLGILSDGSEARDTPSKLPKVLVISGSGVDLDHFAANVRLPPTTGEMTFLLIARLLRDKGIVEFREAAKCLKPRYPLARFQVLGPYDSNPAALTEAEMNAWAREGEIEYLGESTDVRPYLVACDVYVLPSYREGTPRSVLEAMATARPIITTDAPGCRETIRQRSQLPSAAACGGITVNGRGSGSATRGTSVVEGENGFLVPVRDACALAAAMERFMLAPDLVREMGRKSREYAEDRYDVHNVNAVIMGEIDHGNQRQ